MRTRLRFVETEPDYSYLTSTSGLASMVRLIKRWINWGGPAKTGEPTSPVSTSRHTALAPLLPSFIVTTNLAKPPLQVDKGYLTIKQYTQEKRIIGVFPCSLVP